MGIASARSACSQEKSKKGGSRAANRIQGVMGTLAAVYANTADGASA